MTLPLELTPETCLPHDAARATLVGRLWLPQTGPVLVGVRGNDLVDLSHVAPTGSALLELDEPSRAVRDAIEGSASSIAQLDAVLANSDEAARDDSRAWLLAPCDLQVLKASGVTFVSSLLERVIEEHSARRCGQGRRHPRRAGGRAGRQPRRHRARLAAGGARQAAA
jgi:fumarylacetoacetate (FAA) hydrolase family protein